MLQLTPELLEDIKYYAAENESVYSTAKILGISGKRLYRVVKKNDLLKLFGDPMRSNARLNALVGVMPKAAIAAVKSKVKVYTFKGVTAPLSQHAASAGKSVHTVRWHMAKGRSLAYALTISRSSANKTRAAALVPKPQGCGSG